jgi:hypothetical protein
MWSTKKAIAALSIISLLIAPIAIAAPTDDGGPGITDMVLEFFDGLLESLFGASSDQAPTTPPGQQDPAAAPSGPTATTQDGGGDPGCEMGPFSDPGGC